MREAARATSAAPTLRRAAITLRSLDERPSSRRTLVDGGVFANDRRDVRAGPQASGGGQPA